MFGHLSSLVFIIYFILLVILFGIIKFVLKKLLHKEVPKRSMRLLFIIMLVLPFLLLKGCASCMDDTHERIKRDRERTQESYVRKFLIENEAGSLKLPKFNVNSYDSIYNDEKWVIEFEEPLDSTQLLELDPSGVAMVDGRVLFYPIVYGYSDKIDSVFLTNEYREKVREEEESKKGEDLDGQYKYRNFKLELLPDGKTAIILYSYARHKTHRSSGGSHHHHHDD